VFGLAREDGRNRTERLEGCTNEEKAETCAKKGEKRIREAATGGRRE